MRIALVHERVDPSRGGAETYVADLCRGLVSAGHQVELFATSWDPQCLPRGVKCVHVPARGWTRWGRILSFARDAERALRERDHAFDCSIGLINTWHQDVLIPQGGVHAASLRANSQRFPPGWRRGLYILGKRANPKFWLYHAIERRQYDPARGTRIVAVSEMVAGHLMCWCDVARERIRVIPNAIDVGRLSVPDPAATRRNLRTQHGRTEADLIGLFVGHNFRLKGLPPLLQALADRRRRDPGARPIHLFVCGGGKIDPMRRLVDRLNLTDWVHLIGFVPDIRSYYHASDFFVSPTYYDPCSLVVFDALACGLPVITTACNGAGEVMTAGREGFVIDQPGNIPALAGALDQMTNDQARRSLSAAAVLLGRAQSFDRHVERLLSLCAEVASSKHATRNSPLGHGDPAAAPRPEFVPAEF